jgi:glycosyltransferase involved in cell wall biosynthesis
MISVIIPAYRAEATLPRALHSVLAQTLQDWEAIIVGDDGGDYAALLRQQGLRDVRLRVVTTGRVRSGCHNARNVGLAAARGDFIAALDADDVFLPDRLATLLPVAQVDGAGTDNPQVIADATDDTLYRARAGDFERVRLGIADLLDLSVPLFPLIAREFSEPRLPGIELGEDVVANLRLIDRLGRLTMLGEMLSHYRVVTGSLCHNDQSADGFENSYTALIERLENGDRLGLSAANAAIARDRLLLKRDFNRAFATARLSEPSLDFQTFASRRAPTAAATPLS